MPTRPPPLKQPRRGRRPPPRGRSAHDRERPHRYLPETGDRGRDRVELEPFVRQGVESGQVRVGRVEVAVRAPVGRPVRPGSTRRVRAGPDRRTARRRRPAQLRGPRSRARSHALERQGGQVPALGVAMERRVEIGPRIADHGDPPDRELRSGRVVGARRVPGGACGNQYGRCRDAGHEATPGSAILAVREGDRSRGSMQWVISFGIGWRW